MSNRRIRLAICCVLGATGVALGPGRAVATQKFGPIQLSGNLQSQNLIRTPNESTFEYIQNRNTAHIRLDYDWLQGGLFYNKYNIPFLESSHLFVLWRGVYDSIYDTTPGFFEKEDAHGKAYPGLKAGELLTFFDYANRIGIANAAGGRTLLTKKDLSISALSHGQRTAFKFDNQLREAYADIKFRTIPLTVRAGRQQIVWGESDNFRMLDRVNTLDTTWHFVQELPPPPYGWDEIRRPFWMFKFLYDLGNIGSLSQNFLEWYWNPGDWWPIKIAYEPRPWGVKFYNPLTNVVDGAFFAGPCLASPFVVTSGPRKGQHACNALMNGTKLFEHGNYTRDPFDNSQVGVRYHAIAPFGLEFTLNYLYQRWAGDDGSPSAPIRILPKNDRNNALAVKLFQRGILPAEYFTPYVHTVGFAANYSDETYTQTVFRTETVYDFGIPFFDLGRVTVLDVPAIPGITNKNMWKGMLAFDRPTWIRTVNKKSTVFITGQFFWHYLVDNPSCQPQVNASIADPAKRARAGSCLVGPFDLPSIVRIPTTTPTFRDKVRDWETIASLAAFSFYRGGSVLPVLGMAIDPTNHYVMEAFGMLEYVVRDDVSVNVVQRYFINPTGKDPIFSPWGFGSLSKGRSETGVRLTLQF